MNQATTSGTRSAPSPFGRLLKRLRSAALLTQEALAERAGVSARLVSDLERGTIQRSRPETVRLLADALDLDGDDRARFLDAGRTDVTADDDAAPIVGRATDVDATIALLATNRLVTLVGPGGVGKTRLATHVAERVAGEYPAGTLVVDLAPVEDPDRILPLVARTLGGRETSDAGLVEGLYAAIGDSRRLIVLDNVEHLVAAAPAIAAFLDRCPGLTILATGRQPFGLDVERIQRVDPLTLPPLDRLLAAGDVAQVPAVELFLLRAREVRPDYRLTDANAAAVAEVTVRLDGLPLAIELAAVRLRVLSVRELLDRLGRRLPLLSGAAGSRTERHQTMRATIGWSYDLLAEIERGLFRRLAVFAGGFTVDAAVAVGATGRSGPVNDVDVLDILASLLDKNLVQRLEARTGDSGESPTRFAMLETIREFGLDALADAGEADEARRRHASWCVELVEVAGPNLTGPDQGRWFERLEAEHENLLAALGWAVDEADADSALRLTAGLYRFWATTGRYDEGRRWLERALAVTPSEPSAARAWSCLGAGVIAYFQGDYDQAEAHGTAGLEIFRRLDVTAGIASSYGNLGLVADAREQYDRATELYERALALFREIGDRTRTGFMLGNLGLIAYFEGNHERARRLHEEALDVARELGDRNSEAITLSNLGLVAFAVGDHPRAAALQRETIEIRRSVSNRGHMARSLENVALIAASTGRPASAVRLFAAADAIRTEIGSPIQPNDREIHDRHLERARSELDDAAFAAAWSDGSSLAPDAAVQLALDVSAEVEAGSAAVAS